jgi:hypothetical protein
MRYFSQSTRHLFQFPKLFLLLLCGLYSVSGHAVLNLTLEQLGPDVNLTASGSVDLNALGSTTSGTCNGGVNSLNGLAVAGVNGSEPCIAYTIPGFSPNPRPSFGGTSASFFLPSSGTGIAGLAGTSGSPTVILPAGYVTGTSLSASSVFSGTDLATLDVVPGTYTLSWGSGVAADSIVVEIRVGSVPAATAVPTLPVYLLFVISGVVGLLGARRLRRRTAGL